jgi:hypothetical protein
MKRAFISVFRLAMLVGALVLLPSIKRGPEASAGCASFNTYNADCPSCCSIPNGQYVNLIDGGGSGSANQILSTVATPCGVIPKGSTCAAGCGSTYDQGNISSSCCSADGTACHVTADCCTNGYICLSGGTCGVCIVTGDSGCGTAADCCISGDTCTDGICTAPSSGGDFCDGAPCPPGCTPKDNWCSGNSPIILDLNGKGFILTSAAGGVKFDISGTGHPIQIGWTAQGVDNAFLALPGADGLVDSGMQLFGNFTPQPPSPDPNGFLALAVYDLPANGGNGDGVIDSGDAIYPHLRLWIDANHDGISQPEELHTLPSLGVISISLHDTLSRRVDQYGNVFRYKAPVDPNDPDPAHVGRTAYDVFFVTLNPSGTP